MGENDRPYRRYLFTVRLWREEPSADQAEWRGQVQCASDGDRRAFQDWPDLIAFFAAKLEESKQDGEI